MDGYQSLTVMKAPVGIDADVERLRGSPRIWKIDCGKKQKE